MANKELILNADMSLEQKALALLVCIAQERKAEMTRLIRGTGLSLLQLELLHTLSYAPDKRLTVNQLKAALVDESPNVSRTLNKLVDAGYVTKERSEADQRVVHITITEAGEHAHSSADEHLLEMKLNLSKKDTEALYQILSKL